MQPHLFNLQKWVGVRLMGDNKVLSCIVFTSEPHYYAKQIQVYCVACIFRVESAYCVLYDLPPAFNDIGQWHR